MPTEALQKNRDNCKTLCMNAQQISWDNLEFFLMTAREQTLVAAAKKLGVNHSTVHRRISALEDQLGTLLFDRSPQGYALNPAGEELLEHVVSIEREVMAIDRKMMGRDQRLVGIVHVATVDDLAVSLLPEILSEFRALHPSVTIVLEVETDFADLARRQADIAIRFGELPDAADVVGRRIATARTAAYASVEYLETHGSPDELEQLAEHEIVRGTEHFARLPTEQLLDRYGSKAHIVMRSNSMLARLAAVRGGVGIGFLPCFMADPEPSVERLELPTGRTGGPIWMLLHSDVRTNARVRAFSDFAYERLVEQRGLFSGTE